MVKKILVLFLFFVLVACQSTIEATKENLDGVVYFEYDEESAIFYGYLTNLTDKKIAGFELELFMTFNDGKEESACKIPIEDIEPKDKVKFECDIYHLYSDGTYTPLDNDKYRIEINN